MHHRSVGGAMQHFFENPTVLMPCRRNNEVNHGIVKAARGSVRTGVLNLTGNTQLEVESRGAPFRRRCPACHRTIAAARSQASNGVIYSPRVSEFHCYSGQS
jgi:hypothetical protein